ncbi:Uncharacterised protein [Edwardsiella tarda]|uniref:Uncharacterized protein n=1 Tax=Edwardsiella tarda ATCC 23685 TaxID=500638 RepID=D4F9N2_EDWTA|nr:hypothetical protein EDWATA_03491 [Edwardsiella tarda ATCC 23685]STD28263.1 Uncharacterised protein [Edwardsiella tarda]STD40822.1 Uncharacterised protein [Edwardsiella tarda]
MPADEEVLLSQPSSVHVPSVGFFFTHLTREGRLCATSQIIKHNFNLIELIDR